jgi:hypothetical protein
MAKLKNIVKQLSDKDYKLIYDSLLESNAEKSAYLLKALRERQLSDSKIMTELEVTPNAYYTLRSRLNIRIEEHLVQQMESPRTDILKKVANLNEVLFTKKRTISLTTLKKLEKELIDYDLASELTVIYKSLKKLNINSPDHFHYSQLYNRHIAYMLAVDKAEDLLVGYFKKYGTYYFTSDETERLGLILLQKEMQNVAKLYESHRLYVFQSCMLIFHRLFVEPDDHFQAEGESMEDVFAQVQKIFDTYHLDPLYYHLDLVFEFLKVEYYNHYKVYRQLEKHFEEVNDAGANLIVNYSSYTFPSRFLLTKLERHLRSGTEKDIVTENESLFADIEPDLLDVPHHTVCTLYRALGFYYSERFEEAAKILNGLLNDVSLKKYPFIQMEVKAILALQYCMLRDFELFNQFSSSVQRQIRMFGKDECKNVLLFLKILKIATSEAKKDKPKKIAAIIPRFQAETVQYFAPTFFVKMDAKFISNLTDIDAPGT